MAAIDPANVPRARPGFNFLRSHPAHLIALGFGAGLMRPAPGTWGTACAWLLYWTAGQLWDLSWPVQAVIGVAACGLGTWAAARTGTALGEKDAGEIVIDEIVAFWWVLALLPSSEHPWLLQAAAFVAFRVFDIWKPAPISWVQKHWQNAVGVMLDDLMAGAYTLLVITLWVVLQR